jgi:hypothetical protein
LRKVVAHHLIFAERPITLVRDRALEIIAATAFDLRNRVGIVTDWTLQAGMTRGQWHFAGNIAGRARDFRHAGLRGLRLWLRHQ